MILVDRNTVVAPPSLEKNATRGNRRGKTEEQAIVLAFDAYLKAVPPLEKFEFPFAAYKGDDVKKALTQLFHGKCAYCESRYAGTQPMDVEHWRPKGGVVEPGQTKLADGYPWLAAKWTNLLPSCIDCNRPRVQHDALTGTDETLGKSNQFPVSGPRMKLPAPDSPAAPVEDVALLVDPTFDDPSLHLRFRDDGVAMALTDKGTHSLRVYALNREELVFERLGLAQLIETRLTTIERLAKMIANSRLPEEHLRDLRDLAAHEIDALMALTEPGQRYSAMARQLIEESWPLGVAAAPVPQLWPSAVGDMLRRLGGVGASPNHAALASRLVGFGFEPHLPVSRADAEAGGAAYVRWTGTGTQRSVTLYQNGSGLVSDSKAQLAFAKTVAGAEVPGGVHPTVRYTHAHATVTAVLDAVAAFRGWADQP